MTAGPASRRGLCTAPKGSCGLRHPLPIPQDLDPVSGKPQADGGLEGAGRRPGLTSHIRDHVCAAQDRAPVSQSADLCTEEGGGEGASLTSGTCPSLSKGFNTTESRLRGYHYLCNLWMVFFFPSKIFFFLLNKLALTPEVKKSVFSRTFHQVLTLLS